MRKEVVVTDFRNFLWGLRKIMNTAKTSEPRTPGQEAGVPTSGSVYPGSDAT
jgi:hypothetical protein